MGPRRSRQPDKGRREPKILAEPNEGRPRRGPSGETRDKVVTSRRRGASLPDTGESYRTKAMGIGRAPMEGGEGQRGALTMRTRGRAPVKARSPGGVGRVGPLGDDGTANVGLGTGRLGAWRTGTAAREGRVVGLAVATGLKKNRGCRREKKGPREGGRERAGGRAGSKGGRRARLAHSALPFWASQQVVA